MELVFHGPGSAYGFACGSASGYTGVGNQSRHDACSEPGYCVCSQPISLPAASAEPGQAHAAYQTGHM
jgi:hypothetical protein